MLRMPVFNNIPSSLTINEATIPFTSAMSNLGPTLGVLVLGVFLNTYLYGIVSYQYMAYANTKFNDPLWMKVTVLSLFLLDTVHTASLIHMVWHYSISHFGDVAALSNNIWGLPFTVLVTALIAFLTQLFLGYRIWRLTKRAYLYGFIILTATGSFALGMLCCVKVWSLKSVLDFPKSNSYLTAWLSVEVAVDAIVSSILIYSLIRSRTGFETSDTVINRLMRATIQTGVLCGICSILALIVFLKKPDTQLYGFFGFPISRLYTNTLMDTLLCRQYLRGLLGQRQEAVRTVTGSLRLQVRKDIETELKFDDIAPGSQTKLTKGQPSFERISG